MQQVWQDQEAPNSALQAVAANSYWEGIRPVNTCRHAECDKVEVHSNGCFVKYVKELAQVLADVG